MADLPNFDLNDLIKFDVAVLADATYSTQETVNFVIALAVAFNDMKDFFWFFQMLQDRKPENSNEINTYNGQWNGMINSILRYLVGVFWELTVLLDKNRAAMEHESFKYAEDRIPEKATAHWLTIKKFAVSEKSDMGEKEQKYFDCLVQIRNAIGFHYYSTKNFGNGFSEYVKARGSDAAVYASFGDRLETTRFYFADGATQNVILKLLNEKKVTEKELTDFIKLMNESLRFLIEKFLDGQYAILCGNREQRREIMRERGYK